MTAAALEGRTKYEAGEYARDRGKTAAVAIGYQLLARHLHACAAEDMALLGVTHPAEPRPYMQPVTGGTDEERKARVDAFAARHGVKAHADDATGTYRAVLSFGPCSYVAYMIPDRTMGERLAALYENLREAREAAA